MSPTTVSVLSSAVVALAAIGALVYQVWDSRSQRQFDRAQAFEQRSWEEKVAVVPSVLGALRRAADRAASAPEDKFPDFWTVQTLIYLEDQIQRARRVVDSFSGDSLRLGLQALERDVLNKLDPDDQFRWAVVDASAKKEAALDTSDFDLAAEEWGRQRQALEQIAASAEFLSKRVLDDQPSQLIQACRADLRGPRHNVTARSGVTVGGLIRLIPDGGGISL